jgi:predicted Zn-dependent protease
VQVRLGRYQEALAAYSRAADLAPGIAGYRLRQAELLFQNARESDADVMMRGVVRKNPNYAGSFWHCAD